MRMCVQFTFFSLSRVPFSKQALSPNLQISANSILPRREKIAHCDSFEANLPGCQNRVFIAVRGLIYLQKHVLLLTLKSGPSFEIG